MDSEKMFNPWVFQNQEEKVQNIVLYSVTTGIGNL